MIEAKYESRPRIFSGTPLDEGSAKVLGFLQLSEGWHFGAGVAPAYPTVERALNIVEMLGRLGFEKTDAFPGEDGSILVVGYLDQYCVEVYCRADSSIDVIFEEDDIEIESEPDIKEADLEYVIGERVERWGSTSGSYIRNILIENASDTVVRHSRILPVGESRSSMRIVSEGSLSPASVITFDSSMFLRSPVIRQSSGEFHRTRFPKT